MRRLPTIVRFTAMFVLSVAAGFAAYIGLSRPAKPHGGAGPSATTPAVIGASHDAAVPVSPAPPSHVPALVPSAERPQPGEREPKAAGGGEPQHDVPPARDQLSRKDARALVERVLKGKLGDRDLTPRDRERLVDAVLQLKKAVHRLHTAEATMNAVAVARQRRRVLSALTKIEKITGVPPANLGDLTQSDDAPTGEENGRP